MKNYIFRVAALAATGETNPGMEFFNSGVDVVQSILYILAGLILIMGLVNLAESYGEQNPAAKAKAGAQIAGAVGIFIVAYVLVPKLSTLWT